MIFLVTCVANISSPTKRSLNTTGMSSPHWRIFSLLLVWHNIQNDKKVYLVKNRLISHNCWHRGYSITLGTLCVSVMCQYLQKKLSTYQKVSASTNAKLQIYAQRSPAHSWLTKSNCDAPSPKKMIAFKAFSNANDRWIHELAIHAKELSQILVTSLTIDQSSEGTWQDHYKEKDRDRHEELNNSVTPSKLDRTPETKRSKIFFRFFGDPCMGIHQF